MEKRNAEQANTTVERPKPGGRGRFIAYSVAAFAAALGTVVLALVIFAPESTTDAGAPGSPQEATGFVLFEDYHATLIVSPGAVGENTVDVVLLRHDGGSDTGVSDVVLSLRQPLGGTVLGDFPAQPVAGSPGTFRVSGVSIPSAGKWEFGLSLSGEGGNPVGNTIIQIGAASDVN